MSKQLDKIIRSILDAEHETELRIQAAKAAGDVEAFNGLAEAAEHLQRARVEVIAVKRGVAE